MEETFEEYLKQARWKFTTVAEKYPVENHLELRTAIDSLLIAYDQAVHQALSLGVVVGRSEQLAAIFEKMNRHHITMLEIGDYDKLAKEMLSS